MKRRLLSAAVAVALGAIFLQPSVAAPRGFEVWLMDQSGTAGNLHIFDQEDVRTPNAAVSEVVNLDALCSGAVRGT